MRVFIFTVLMGIPSAFQAIFSSATQTLFEIGHELRLIETVPDLQSLSFPSVQSIIDSLESDYINSSNKTWLSFVNQLNEEAYNQKLKALLSEIRSQFETKESVELTQSDSFLQAIAEIHDGLDHVISLIQYPHLISDILKASLNYKEKLYMWIERLKFLYDIDISTVKTSTLFLSRLLNHLQGIEDQWHGLQGRFNHVYKIKLLKTLDQILDDVANAEFSYAKVDNQDEIEFEKNTLLYHFVNILLNLKRVIMYYGII